MLKKCSIFEVNDFMMHINLYIIFSYICQFNIYPKFQQICGSLSV